MLYVVLKILCYIQGKWNYTGMDIKDTFSLIPGEEKHSRQLLVGWMMPFEVNIIQLLQKTKKNNNYLD